MALKKLTNRQKDLLMKRAGSVLVVTIKQIARQRDRAQKRLSEAQHEHHLAMCAEALKLQKRGRLKVVVSDAVADRLEKGHPEPFASCGTWEQAFRIEGLPKAVKDRLKREHPRAFVKLPKLESVRIPLGTADRGGYYNNVVEGTQELCDLYEDFQLQVEFFEGGADEADDMVKTLAAKLDLARDKLTGGEEK